MKDLFFLIAIIKREHASEYMAFFKEYGVTSVFGTLCNGTAQSKTLDYLGLEKTDKIMLVSILSNRTKDKVLQELVNEMGISVPGNGIALTVPVGSVSGTSGMEFLLGEQEFPDKRADGGEIMNETQYVLILVIAERGSSDLVMEAARKADANGGTVVHAKGVGSQSPEKFFGISIADEKELIYIVAKRCQKASIMRSVMEHAGSHTKAHAVLFSLPVEDVVGLRSVIEK